MRSRPPGRSRRHDRRPDPGITDLKPLVTAPALEGLELIDMRHLQPEDLAPLVGLPNLREVTPGLGSRRKNEAAAAMLGLPPVRGPFDWAGGDA
jgi:hypothetical protein